MTDPAGPHVVAIGGGHGLAVTLCAVNPWAAHVTAVVSTGDDGGSTGRLRASWGVPALGDVRRCLAAMAGPATLWGRLLTQRFDAGELSGHPVGNLLLLALTEELGDLQGACDEVARVAGVDLERHRIVPVTSEAVRLRGRDGAGRIAEGQVAVGATAGLRQVWVEPSVAASEVALDAIVRADLVVLGPGSLYTSVLAAAVVGEVRAALAKTAAPLVYVANLRADGAETAGYDVGDHLEALRDHDIRPDVVVAPSSGVPIGDVAAEVVLADVARPDGLAHDPVALGAALAARVG